MTQTIPNFHDGHLTGVALVQNGAVLSFRRLDGSNHDLVLSGLKAFQIEDFREGNIVYDLEVISGRKPEEAVTHEIMARLFTAPHPQAATTYHDAHAAFIDARLAELSSGAATLVIVTPSYGADVLAFCETVQLRSAAG